MHVRRLAAIALIATAPCAATAQTAITGHYYLQGVMETGSELLLDDGGGFEWYLSYGALDVFARGTWKREKDTVILTAVRETGRPDPPFDDLRLVIRGKDLIPPDGHGAYVLGD